MATITNTVSKYMNGGIDAVAEFKRSINSDNARRKVDGRTEARLIELACGPVPEGHPRWTIRLLEEESKVILETYELPYDEKYPVVCMDEKSYRLPGEAREPLPMISGSDRKIDSEYVRNGTVRKIFIIMDSRYLRRKSFNVYLDLCGLIQSIKWMQKLINGRGQTDFIVLRGQYNQNVIEFKLASNSSLEHVF